ncbi:ArsR/SmtB family transcription factor [Tichowtungia aerotolerans]|uniref:Metalloregulator ArsR/SmtB family transcription factor n=1 Tax=Tichowtungia aerotolerans TaxID=2697043 RepID=A0A6P1MCY0_9BACT|nr:metalloregulator ArsR/SmtB family transcription factor [Tichowtungia aerotolerans]QHI69918.1 metalloregulator ArsR/SmtB family transcription factor [Tichowtungia aerotolerans]
MQEKERELAAEVLKAMAHPIRLGVIEQLADGERTCTELYQELGCSQSMLSQQLRTLCQYGLVSIRKEGATKYCALQNSDFLKLFDCMHRHLRTFLHFENEE